MSTTTSSIMFILDNTFIGTFLAGAALALSGFWIYRRQKSLDLKYDDIRKIRETASSLFANVETASKNYLAVINIFNGNNKTARVIYNALDKREPNLYLTKTSSDLNNLASQIAKCADDLIVLLKIRTGYDEEIKTISTNVPIISLHLAAVITLPKSSTDDMRTFEGNFKEASTSIQDISKQLTKLEQ